MGFSLLSQTYRNKSFADLRLVRVPCRGKAATKFHLQKRVPHGPMVFIAQMAPPYRRNAMHTFLERFASVVAGFLCGFDRLFFSGSLRRLAHAQGVQSYLYFNRIWSKDFAQHSQDITARLECASLRQARELGREIRYLNNSQVRKDDVAREIAARDRIKSGLVCVLRSVDPCMSVRCTGTARPGSRRFASANASVCTCTTIRFTPFSA
jgi:hypothetical protein